MNKRELKIKRNIPKLRFPEFSDEWKEKKLRETGNIMTGATPPTIDKECYGGSFPWITPTDINSGKNIYKSAKLLTKKGIEKGRFIPKNSLLVTCIASIGKNAILRVDGSCNQQINVIIPNKNNNIDFLYYLLAKSKNKLIRFAGAGGMQMLNKKDFSDLKFRISLLQEQKKIGRFLGIVDEWIENLKEQKESFELYKKGLMQKIFSQEVRFKDKDGKDFPDWEEKKLGEIATFQKGIGISKNDIVENGKNKCIRYGELYTKYKEVIRNIISYTSVAKEKSTLSKKNDILMPTSDVTPRGLATASALDEEGVILGGDILIIRSKKILNKFFCYRVKAQKKDIMCLVSGVTVYHIYGSDLKNMKFSFPSFPEQQRIADFLTSVDKLIESKQQQITQAEIWKKGLMQGLFI